MQRARRVASRPAPHPGSTSRSRRPTPTNVPLVPRPATKCVSRPPVCSMISGAGRVVVRAPVERVVVLVRVEVPLRVGGKPAPRLADRAVRALERIGQHQLRAIRPQHALAFRRDVVRHAQPHRYAERGAEHRVGNAGVARGRVEQGLARRQRAAGQPLEHHPPRRPILHGPARVGELRLAVELDAGLVQLDPVEPDERSAPDQVEQRRGATCRGKQGGRHGGKPEVPRKTRRARARQGKSDYRSRISAADGDADDRQIAVDADDADDADAGTRAHRWRSWNQLLDDGRQGDHRARISISPSATGVVGGGRAASAAIRNSACGRMTGGLRASRRCGRPGRRFARAGRGGVGAGHRVGHGRVSASRSVLRALLQVERSAPGWRWRRTDRSRRARRQAWRGRRRAPRRRCARRSRAASGARCCKSNSCCSETTTVRTASLGMPAAVISAAPPTSPSALVACASFGLRARDSAPTRTSARSGAMRTTPSPRTTTTGGSVGGAAAGLRPRREWSPSIRPSRWRSGSAFTAWCSLLHPE